MLVHHAVRVRRAAEETDFLAVKKLPDDEETVPVIRGDLLWGELALFHADGLVEEKKRNLFIARFSPAWKRNARTAECAASVAADGRRRADSSSHHAARVRARNLMQFRFGKTIDAVEV
jgi:hypothetical protein